MIQLKLKIFNFSERKEKTDMKLGDKKFIQENGKWRIDAVIELDDGRRVHCNKRWFDTKAEAKQWYMQWETEQFSKDSLDGSMKFERFLDEWMQKRETEVRGTTIWTSDMSVVRCFVYPHFCNKSVSQAFSQKNIIEVYNHIKAHDCGVKRKNTAIILIKSMIDYAYSLCYIDDKTHQLALVRMPKLREEITARKEAEDRIPWTEEEVSKFLEACGEGSRDWLTFKIFLDLGLRIGEFVALKPRDIDWEHGFVKVSHQIVYKGNDKPIDTNVLKSPNSYRSMIISESDIKLLYDYIRQMGIGEDEYIFQSTFHSGAPLSKNNFRTKWNAIVKKAGIRKMVPHGARHIVATKWLAKCSSLADQSALAKMLGHTPSVDLNVYSGHEDLDLAKKIFG